MRDTAIVVTVKAVKGQSGKPGKHTDELQWDSRPLP